MLTVGSQASPKDDVLKLGAEGQKQLAVVKEEGKTGLPAFFQKEGASMKSVLGPGGLPPMPLNLGQSMAGKRYELNEEQTYENKYVTHQPGKRSREHVLT